MDIEKVKKLCEKAGKSFVYREDADNDETCANFLFVGQHDGEEVVFDAFMYTLEMEYISEIYEEARNHVIELNPKFGDADFEALEGEHIDALEKVADELAKDTDYDIQEFVELDEPTDLGVALDVCLNIPEVTDEAIEKFVKDFNGDSLALDETFYSFSLEEEY